MHGRKNSVNVFELEKVLKYLYVFISTNTIFMYSIEGGLFFFGILIV